MRLVYFTLICLFIVSISFCLGQEKRNTLKKPVNILFAISDDQSYPYAGAYGNKTVHTPAFNSVAKQGILFTNAFAASPGCAPSRSAILTGRYPWQNEEAGGHQTLFPLSYKVMVDVMEENGYFIGYTGKGCAPFNWKLSGRKRNPAGPAFNKIRYSNENELPANGISGVNYSANFEQFLSLKPKDKPFFFWYGAFEPHRRFEQGSGLKAGKKQEDVFVPGFLPDHTPIQTDIMDYALEVDWFDYHLGKMIKSLEEAGELENTIIIVTSDNGMAFPRAKANCYEYGIHVPLAISWPREIKGNRVVDDLISLADLTPTIFDIIGITPEGMKPITGKSFYNILSSNKQGLIDPTRTAVYSSRERHSSARWSNLGYPIRSIRTQDFLYIRNYTPERWPSGAPQMLNAHDPSQMENMYGLNAEGKFEEKAFWDIDAAPSKTYLIENHAKKEVAYYFDLSMAKRPKDELYDIKNDPYCLKNLANSPAYAKKLEQLKNKLTEFLKETGDPRHVGPDPDIFENYQRFSIMRPFPKPDWIKQDE
ncbi:sulfatase [Fulvivirgaceae bacterium BMA10]|uniref:Sulfatase n=1 Tax=Splendidivirga corallicola TaxID=3051826 RepID=A0ABT8KUW4_9BACT|nr:sulfatase [Fulvivirgaceae bacterium BMA10]